MQSKQILFQADNYQTILLDIEILKFSPENLFFSQIK